jgi:hypothetical protein
LHSLGFDDDQFLLFLSELDFGEFEAGLDAAILLFSYQIELGCGFRNQQIG